MIGYITGPYDKAGRYSSNLNPPELFAWLIGDDVDFEGWLDTRTIAFPGSPERIMDRIARLIDRFHHRVPWALILEFKLDPEQSVFGQTRVYEGFVFLSETPDDLPGSRYYIGSLVINFRGVQAPFRRMRLGHSDIECADSPRIINMSQFIADELLVAIDAGKRGLSLLPWIPLMQGADQPSIIERWKQLAERETHRRKKSDYGALALIFAEAAGRQSLWQESLKEWNMVESVVVNEWIKQGLDKGRDEGRKEGELIGQIQLLQKLLSLPISSHEELVGKPLDQLQTQVDHLEKQLRPHTNGVNGTPKG